MQVVYLYQVGELKNDINGTYSLESTYEVQIRFDQSLLACYEIQKSHINSIKVDYPIIAFG